ncbi:hypothetical protein TNCV_5094921 [Trichonephila clavipes]|nr:hypothetical protein TNCV_5094921 [Trichonephila clavipes]
MWSMIARRLTQITPPAATPEQLWQRVEAARSAVPQEYTQSLFESMPRRVAAVDRIQYALSNTRSNGNLKQINVHESQKSQKPKRKPAQPMVVFRINELNDRLRNSAYAQTWETVIT